jgi:hypothetical protein
MELEGFGASLVGRAIYVCTPPEKAWIPHEFISGTTYNCRICISGSPKNIRLVDTADGWNAVFHPLASRDWSCIATMIQSMGPHVLIVFDSYAPAAPASFITFLDNCISSGRVVLTRIWIGTHVEIPCIPDAILFPVFDGGSGAGAAGATEAYDMMRRLPGRGGHGAWAAPNLDEWSVLVKATADGHLGILISDIGEHSWSVFWHKVEDSYVATPGSNLQMAKILLGTGMKLLDR